MNHCRICSAPLSDVLVDLGTSPPSNSYLTADELEGPEVFLPLVVYSCRACGLAQLPEHEVPQKIFGEQYLYFSGYSASWREHTRVFAEQMIANLELGEQSLVIEVASNDGTTLRQFRDRGVQVLGVEPAPNVAKVAEDKGVPTVVAFLGAQTARDLPQADLVHGANVLAHVPDLHDFCEGLRRILKPGGTLTLEFPSFIHLIESCAFDTIYHEHYSYLSLVTASRVLSDHGLDVYDIEELQTHGGSIRLFAGHRGEAPSVTERCVNLFSRESLFYKTGYAGSFASRVARTKLRLLRKLVDCAELDEVVLGFGAPAKATTLLNYCGIKSDLLRYVTDDSPWKQGRYMPGCRIPIYSVEELVSREPKHVLVLPWNLRRDALHRLGPILDTTELIYPIDS